MNTPIILICGEAGSGKDTVADFIKKHTKNTIAIAQADPMKRLAQNVFDFTSGQLWGPSECRNAPDPRFDSLWTWKETEDYLKYSPQTYKYKWIKEVLPNLDSAINSLYHWFACLAADHVTLGSDKPTKQLTPRTVLQTLGTEFGRNIDVNMWSNLALNTAKQLFNGGQAYHREIGVSLDTTKGVPDFVLITDGRFCNEIVNAAAMNCHRLLVTNPNPNTSREAVQKAGIADHSSEAALKQIPAHWYTHEIINNKNNGLAVLEEEVCNYVFRLRNRMK